VGRRVYVAVQRPTPAAPLRRAGTRHGARRRSATRTNSAGATANDSTRSGSRPCGDASARSPPSRTAAVWCSCASSRSVSSATGSSRTGSRSRTANLCRSCLTAGCHCSNDAISQADCKQSHAESGCTPTPWRDDPWRNGGRCSPLHPHVLSESLYFYDPDGNLLEFWSPRGA